MAKSGILPRTNSVFRWMERRGIIQKTPNIIKDYHKDYPGLKILEDNHHIIRKECENILMKKEDITNVSQLLGDYTKGGIHTIKWKSFMLKSGSFLEENCKHCPETRKLLAQVPKVRMAFFSILDPKQYITPHEGYYDGYMRYHLGVIIPNNNENRECWIRIANAKIEKKTLPDLGDTYYWKNGEGVIFNDNYTHDAENTSDEVRVILWLDMERKLPRILSAINTFMLNIAYSTKGVKQVAKNSVVKF